MAKNITVLDIGSKSIKLIVGEEQKNGKLKLVHYEIVPTPEGAVVEGKIMDSEALEEVLRTLAQENKKNIKNVRLVLSGDYVVTRNFEFPEMPIDELKQALIYEMEILLPEALEFYVIDSYVADKIEVVPDGDNVEAEVETETVTRCLVQGVAIEKEIVNDYIDCIKKAGFAKLTVVDIQSNSIEKLFCDTEGKYLTKDEAESYDNIGVIDIGYERTNVLIYQDNNPFLFRHFYKGLNNIYQEISKVMEMSDTEVENWIKKSGLEFLKKDIESMNIIERELYESIYGIIQELAMETYQIIEFFKSKSRVENLDQLYLIGGGANLEGIAEFFVQYLDIPVHFGNELLVNYDTEISQAEKNMIVTCIGALIRREMSE
jgi:type IV pilus assembly protein PilM